MLKHADVWRAIDRLATKHGMSASGLARRSGLDPTTFNKSKRITKEGKQRWPSTESVSKVLAATGDSLAEFVALMGEGNASVLAQRVPVIDFLGRASVASGASFAAPRIAAAIRLASQRQDCDALILARGGGSLEDLWAFNEEPVARALFECRIPIVCGVGHETDDTIADLVADVRAPTPTAAAELLSPDQREWRGYFEQKTARLEQLFQDALSARQQKLDWLTARLVHPKQRIALSLERLANLERQLQSALVARLSMASNRCLELSARLDRLSPQARIDALGLRFEHCIGRLSAAMQHALERQQQRLRRAAQSLNNLSPLSTLERGYAIVEKSATKQIIRNAHEVRTGEHVDTRLAHGRLHCLVKGVVEDD